MKLGRKKVPANEVKKPFTVYVKNEILTQNYSLEGKEEKCKEDVIDFLYERIEREPPNVPVKRKSRPSEKSVLKKDSRVPKVTLEDDKVDEKKPQVAAAKESKEVLPSGKVNLAEALKNA